jgi:hypothetical protein
MMMIVWSADEALSCRLLMFFCEIDKTLYIPPCAYEPTGLAVGQGACGRAEVR